MKIVRYEHDNDSIEAEPVGVGQEGIPLVRLTMLGWSDDNSGRVEVFMNLPTAEAREFADTIKELSWAAEKAKQ